MEPENQHITATRSSTPEQMTTTAKKSKSSSNNASHGFMFEVKLLTLFLIRATAAGYQFALTTNAEKLGGKLDDLIFKYLVDAPNGRQWRYRYLQAKHREDEGKKIQAAQLLEDSGDFSLGKYFRSYFRIKARGEDVQDCIICTNINFNVAELNANGIELVPYNEPDNILEFEEKFQSGKTPARYRLKMTDNLYDRLKKSSDIQTLAENLQNYSIIYANDSSKGTLDLRNDVFGYFHVALVEEKVIDLKTSAFHRDFVNADGLSESATQLRELFITLAGNESWKDWKFKLNHTFGKSKSKAGDSPLPRTVTKQEIDSFFCKLVFLVDTPKENEFESILQARDVSKYYNLRDSVVQTDRISKEMLNWFKDSEKESNWLTHDDGKRMLLSGVTKVSVDYQNELRNNLEFNQEAIDQMAAKLRRLLESRENISHITTEWPSFTVSKVVASLKTVPNFELRNHLLVTSFNCLEDMEEKERWRNIVKLTQHCNYLIIVVCENDLKCENLTGLFPHDEKRKKWKNKVIVVSRNEAGIEDAPAFNDLSPESKDAILSREILFQGNKKDIKTLVGDGLVNKVLDFASIKELIEGEDIAILPFNTSRFDQTLYIRRKLTFPVSLPDEQFWDELAKKLKCKKEKLQRELNMDSKGNINWFVDEKKRSEIWTAMAEILKENSKTGPKLNISENDLIDESNSGRRTIIISGVAGTGKSTVLSQFYEEIKKMKPQTWVIRLNLVNHTETFLKFNFDPNSPSSAIDFFTLHFPLSTNSSSFARSLLKHRFEMTGQIVIMLDGFDEIDGQIQEKVVKLMNAIRHTKVDRLYVTTRPHLIDKLQNEIFQFAYTLENLSCEDQGNYLFDYWKINLKVSSMEEELVIRHFANSLVDRVSETLKDEERSFVGIPLQCYILATCYQSELQTLIKNIRNGIESTEVNVEIPTDVVSLYRQLISTKRRIFCDDKANAQTSNHIMICAVNVLIERIESHLTKVAIETLFTVKKDVDALWPSSSSHKSKTNRVKKDKATTELGLKFGLTFKEGENAKVQFLHRTYAEYLVAKYIYEGFLLDDSEHNELLDSEPIRRLIVREILIKDEFDGVRVFFDAFLKEIVESEKWRNLVDQRLSGKLPIRLKLFIEEIRHRRPIEHPPLFQWKNKALAIAAKSKNVNIFTFICDCLDVTICKKEIQQFLAYTFEKYFEFSDIFYEQSSQVLKRCLGYFDNQTHSAVRYILCRTLRYVTFYVMSERRKETKQNVQLVLDFMEKHRKVWKKNMQGYIPNKIALLKCFIYDEYYDGLLRKYLELLSFALPNDTSFLKILEYSFFLNNLTYWNRCHNDSIKRTLDILSDIGRTKVTKRISRLVLLCWPIAFEKFYLSRELTETESKRGMIVFYRAALNGEIEIFERLLNKTQDSFESIKHALHFMTYVDNGLTPFYVAAARGHKDMCFRWLQFFKSILFIDPIRRTLKNSENTFLLLALADAITLRQVNMFQVILTTVKQIMGNDYLIALLKSNMMEENRFISIFAASNTKNFFTVLVKVLVEKNDDKEYQHLNDLIFQDVTTVQNIYFVKPKTLRKMMAVSRCDLVKRLLSINLSHGFMILENILTKLESDQRTQTLQTIISTKVNKKTSYLVEWLKSQYWSHERMENVITVKTFSQPSVRFITDRPKCQYHDYDTFIKCVSENMGEVAVKEMALHDNGRAITYALLFNEIQIFNIAVARISNENRDLVGKTVIDNAIQLIEEMYIFSKPNCRFYWINIYNLVVEYADNQRLKHFVDVISAVRNLNGRQYSIWNDSFEDDKYYYDVEDGMKKVDAFLKCVSEKLGEATVKDLVVHDKGKVVSQILLCYDEILFEAMLAYLSMENRMKLIKQLLDQIPQTMTDIFLDPERRNCLYWMNIINYIVANAESEHLQNLVNTISTLHDLEGVKCSIWSDFLCDAEEYKDFTEKLNSFLRLVSEKLGEGAVKKLLLHDEGKAITCALLRYDENFANVLLAYLFQESQVEVGRCVIDNTPELTEKLFLDKEANWIPSWMNTLQFLLDYADNGQLSKILDVILKKPWDRRVFGGQDINSIWGAYMDAIFYNYPASFSIVKNAQVEKVDKFLKCVSEKLDQSTVKILLIHDNDQAVIRRAALRGQHNLVETMLTHLNDKDRDEVRRKFVVEGNNNAHQ